MSGFTDYHAHFVYGVDDGAQTREEMYAMLDAAAADGVRHLFATSHSTPGMEHFPQEVYDRHLALARAYCTQKGYDLKLEHGSELLYTPATGYAAVQRQMLTLGDTGWVLLEFVPNITAKELETALQEITGAGYRILVAHIERYPCLAQHGLLARLHEQLPAALPDQLFGCAGQRLLAVDAAGALDQDRAGGRGLFGCAQLHLAPYPDAAGV